MPKAKPVVVEKPPVEIIAFLKGSCKAGKGHLPHHLPRALWQHLATPMHKRTLKYMLSQHPNEVELRDIEPCKWAFRFHAGGAAGASSQSQTPAPQEQPQGHAGVGSLPVWGAASVGGCHAGRCSWNIGRLRRGPHRSQRPACLGHPRSHAVSKT